jgi:hypothetical protein
MRDRDISVGLGEEDSTRTKAPGHRGMRGGMELKVVGFILLLSAAGFLWIQMRQGVTKEQARLYRYKDDKGNTAYTDSLEKVPAAQRQAVMNDKALPDITTVDYDSYLEAVSEKKQEQKGFVDSLKDMFRAEPAGTKKPDDSSGARAQKGGSTNGNDNVPAPSDLKGITDVPKVVNESLSSMTRELGG